jgi:hypothetical protein
MNRNNNNHYYAMGHGKINNIHNITVSNLHIIPKNAEMIKDLIFTKFS